MKLLKVLIVDDERLHRDGIKFLLNKLDYNYKIAMANNGTSAIEYLKEDNFHIVITDIKMPLFDGLQLIEYINYNYPDIKVIICSAYNDFEYAKVALKNKVNDYLIKPVNRKEFNDIISNIHHNILIQIESYKLKLESAIFKILHNVSFSHTTIIKLLHKLEWLEDGRYTIVYIHFKESLRKDDIENNIREKMNDHRFLYIALNECCCVLLEHHKDYYNSNEIRDNYKRLFNFITHQYGNHFTFFVSNEFSNINNLSKIFKHLKCLTDNEIYKQHTGIYFNDNTNKKYHYNHIIVDQKINDILYSIENRSLFDIKSNIENLFNELYKVNYSLIFIKYILCEIAKKLIDYKLINTDVEELINAIMSSTDLDFVKNHLLNYIDNNTEKTGHDCYINDLVSYIHSHYNEDISLNLLAEKVYLTPSYISMMFKKRIGQNLSEYLINLRMEKAQEIILNSNKRICDICTEVGYSNVPYFSTLFKKYHGITPSSLRKHRLIETR